MSKNWPLWEVFVRSKNGLEHRHFGSLHAADAEMALENARDVYTRRNEGVSIWVVESKDITASNPENNGELFEPAQDKNLSSPDILRFTRRSKTHVIIVIPMNAGIS